MQRALARVPFVRGGARVEKLPASRLREATSQVFHQFWGEGPSLLTAGFVHWEYVVSARQITDAYLLTLAVPRGLGASPRPAR